MNTIEWLQARVEDLKVDIQFLSENVKRAEGEISTWTKVKEDRLQDLEDHVKIQHHLSLILDLMLLAETP